MSLEKLFVCIKKKKSIYILIRNRKCNKEVEKRITLTRRAFNNKKKKAISNKLLYKFRNAKEVCKNLYMKC